MNPPQLWIVAGPNGAGKTTCVQRESIRTLIPDVVFLNPDDRTKLLLQSRGFQGFTDAPETLQIECFKTAATAVEAELTAAIRRGDRIGIETVLSTNKYRPLVEEVLRLGGSLKLLYVTVATPAIAIERVANRVSRGGHGVPPEKIVERYQRSHINLAWFAARAEHFWVIDNSGSDHDAPMLAYGTGGHMEYLDATTFETLRLVLTTLPRSPG